MTDKKQTALARQPKNDLVIRDVNALRVQFDESKYNVLAPTVHMPGGLPPGTRLIVTEVKIDPDASRNGPKEVFPLPGGNLMPSKVSLDRIANAAGVSWLEERRQDNANHPHYCEMFVKGKMRDFDGTVRELTGHKAVDLREDAGGGVPGKDYDEILSKARKAKPPRDPSSQLMEARKFIQEIAVSKAKNRAIASGLGIKRGYTRAELNKPFIVPKLSMDPTNQVVQHAVVADMIGETAVKAMFGPDNSKPGAVVDAEFEDSSSSEMPSGNDGDESAGNPLPQPADSEPPSMDEPPPIDNGRDPNEKPDEGELKHRLSAAWQRARKAGMQAREWGSFVRTNTGKANEGQLTIDDLGQIDAAVEAYVDSMSQG